MFVGRPSVRQFVNTYFACRDISLRNRGISMTLGKNIYLISAHYWKDSEDQRSKVKVMTTPNAITTEACISTALRRDSLAFFYYTAVNDNERYIL